MNANQPKTEEKNALQKKIEFLYSFGSTLASLERSLNPKSANKSKILTDLEVELNELLQQRDKLESNLK